MADDRQNEAREFFMKRINAQIPHIFISNIRTTVHTTNAAHKEDIVDMGSLLIMAGRQHPTWYVEKSGIGASPMPELCKSPFTEGTVQNALRNLEKEYFNVIGMLYCAAYRPIMPVLRQILEQASYVLNSITNKADFTGNPEDHGKALSHAEFENFRYHKEHLHDNAINGVVGNKWKPYGKSFKKIREHVPHIKFKDKEGYAVLKELYGYLSKSTHGNTWKVVSDRDDNIHNIENISLYITSPNHREYHETLMMIFKTYEVSLYMLLRAAYLNIGYFDREKADEYFGDMRIEASRCRAIPSIRNLLASPPAVENHHMDMDEEEECPECETTIIRGTKCPVCDWREYDVLQYP